MFKSILNTILAAQQAFGVTDPLAYLFGADLAELGF